MEVASRSEDFREYGQASREKRAPRFHGPLTHRGTGRTPENPPTSFGYNIQDGVRCG